MADDLGGFFRELSAAHHAAAADAASVAAACSVGEQPPALAELGEQLDTLLDVEWAGPPRAPHGVAVPEPRAPGGVAWILRGLPEQLAAIRAAVRAAAGTERVRGELAAQRRKVHRIMGWREHITRDVALTELRRFAIANPDVPIELFAIHMIAYVDSWEELTAIMEALQHLLTAAPVEAAADA